MTKLAILFPGQGAQAVGMGKDLFDQFDYAKKLFNEIDRLANRPLSKLCFEGPAEELKHTLNTQPTVLAASIVAWECYKHAGGPEPAYVAGHSLGEFSALYAAGSLSLPSVVRLVEKRSELMEACPPGSMSAVIGLKYADLNALCDQVTCEAKSGKAVVVANFNTPEQLVISGDPDSIAEVTTAAKSNGAKVIPLPVGGAFHSPLMNAAASQFNKLIEQVEFSAPKYPIVQNYNAAPTTDPSLLKQTLAKQMNNSVRWCETIQYMLSQRVTHFIEIGPGKALSGMVKKIDRAAQTYNIEDSVSLAQTISALQNPVAA